MCQVGSRCRDTAVDKYIFLALCPWVSAEEMLFAKRPTAAVRAYLESELTLSFPFPRPLHTTSGVLKQSRGYGAAFPVPENDDGVLPTESQTECSHTVLLILW